MKPELERAINEVLEAWETPDSPEALAGAMYQMARIYKAEIIEDAKEQTRRELRKLSRHNAHVVAPPTLDPDLPNDVLGGCPPTSCSGSSEL